MFSRSLGSSTTVWVCEPRHVCTCVNSFGFLMSEISKMRMPRTRSVLTVSRIGPLVQSFLLSLPSDDMNSRLRYTLTSFCDAGHMNVDTILGLAGFDMSQIW